MDELQSQNNQELVHCRYDDSNNNNRLMDYLNLDNRTDDPLRGPEVTINLHERTAQLPLHPLEEPEEDLFDDETDISYQDENTESEVNLKEQVVPSSQLSNGYKYVDDLTISGDEIDEGIFEDEPVSNLILPDDNNRYDSQPP